MMETDSSEKLDVTIAY